VTDTKAHTRKLFDWLNQVKADVKLPASAFKVAFEIAQHVNSNSGAAWPSQQTVGDAIGLSETTVKDAVARLRDRGHLAIEPGRGRGHSSRYRLAFQDPEKGRSADPIGAEKGRSADPIAGVKGSDFRNKRVGRPPTNNLREQSKGGRAGAREAPPDFENEKAKEALPKDWQPLPVDLAYAATKLTPAEIDSEIRKFRHRNRLKPGRDADWCFHEWIDHAIDHKREHGRGRGKGNGAAVLDPRTFTPAQWAARVARWKDTGDWPEAWGPSPHAPGCLVPRHVLEAHARGPPQ